jgi:hypothetical protein
MQAEKLISRWKNRCDVKADKKRRRQACRMVGKSDIWTSRKTENKWVGNGYAYKSVGRQSRPTGVQAGEKVKKQTTRCTGGKKGADIGTNRQADKQAGRQANKRKSRQLGALVGKQGG